MAAQPAAIATAHPLATAAGERILRQGGNAFDAAIAITAALAVVEPYGSGLGGGGFWLLRTAKGQQWMLDGRETAPLAAHRDMYLDADGKVIDGLSVNGPLAAGIPGIPAGIDHLARSVATLPLPALLQPAIELAEQGFVVDDEFRRMLGFRLDAIRASAAASRVLLHSGELPPLGHRLQQPELAQTLRLLAKHGRDGFYGGEVAQRLVEGVRRHGGIWTLQDLETYRVVERQPVSFSWQGMHFTAAALPSSGGIVMAQIFNQLGDADLSDLLPEQQIHLLTEAMRRAYRDRAQYLGDADVVAVPQTRLLSQAHAETLRAGIDMQQATPSADLPATAAALPAGDNTTHFSVLDSDGNMVAATLSLNYPFGSGFMPEGTGVLLNDEMDDFSIKPGVPNVYGLVGAEANAIAPGKRMLSSMSPTIIESGGRVALIGTPGGSRIISMVALGALAFKQGASADDIVNMHRFHHQYLPDKLQIEPDSMSPVLQQELQLLGHELDEQSRRWGNMQLIILDRGQGTVQAASDTRGIGRAVVMQAED